MKRGREVGIIGAVIVLVLASIAIGGSGVDVCSIVSAAVPRGANCVYGGGSNGSRRGRDNRSICGDV